MSVANMNLPTGPFRLGWKRKASDDEDETVDLQSKKAKCSWYVTLQSESPQPSDEDNESIYSFQEKETDSAKDTSDTSTHTWVSSSEHGDVSVHLEYEVDSLSEDANPFAQDTSSSDPEDIMAIGVLTAICDTDLGLAADSEDSRSSIDSEIGRADYWTCVQCNADNNNPLFRYCEKCYQIRKNFFPPRPKRKKHRPRRDLSKSSRTSLTSREDSKEELTSMDSGLGSSQETKCSLSLELDLDKVTRPNQSETPTSSASLSSKSVDTVDSGFPNINSVFGLDFTSGADFSSGDSDKLTKETSSSSLSTSTSTSTSDAGTKETVRESALEKNVNEHDTESGIERSSSASDGAKEFLAIEDAVQPIPSRKRKLSNVSRDDADTDEVDCISKIKKRKGTRVESGAESKQCLICTVAIKDGVFVHGSTSHICCCYRCAVKVWRTNGRCPICNRRVTNVIKAFFM
ncbi:E3 ubiquitin-protein ligase Mdm2 isoform X2 [Cephus cinctus]|uniref:E3 ubiquitin-protein ligase Mdm2 isoform X2 n=1 Tax=Cephus cinctus TaxID=211228 RepID=A0AAJ7BYJ1_CEPCN|nr:E3 ubiquitin-protein ligase Mdm2 isoform X2 [Cephus cinctus]